VPKLLDALRQLFAEAAAYAPAVLLLADVDTLVGTRGVPEGGPKGSVAALYCEQAR
jgi:hypothetical protein